MSPTIRVVERDTAVIILAAGLSSRMGGVDKIWADLDGRPLISHAIATLAALPATAVVILVGPADRHAALCAFVPAHFPVHVTAIEGGARRQDSVAAGLTAVDGAAANVRWVLVHDGARPLVTADLAGRVLDAARRAGAAIPGIPLVDTVKRIDDSGHVAETVDRASLRAVQTPQAFDAALLRRAHAEVLVDVTDDAAMVETLGQPVAVVEGDPRNLKVTTPTDLAVARALLAQSLDASSDEPRG